MAQADFTELTNVLTTGDVKRGVTAGQTPPNGGGSFVYGMNSLNNNPGGVALYCNLADFSPMAKGATISCAMRKAGGGGNTNHAPFIFLGLPDTDINSIGYMLGLSTEDPSNIVLRKGSLITGVPASALGEDGVLAKSSNTVAIDTWVHLRLDMVVNTTGDVVLNVYENDLSANAVTAPSWTAITGMKDTTNGIEATAYIDDALHVNSGSAPLTSGRGGLGGNFSDISRALYFDHFELIRQV